MAIRNEFKADFMAFKFNNKWSYEYGLVRCNDGGDRYQDNLVPEFSDESDEIPGGLGAYYWGSKFNKRVFNIVCAYDGITEVEKREIKNWLYPDDELHGLVFYEKPYVVYYVKLEKAPVFQELCFDEVVSGDVVRKYKGELKLSFVAYMPFGVCSGEMRGLNHYNDDVYENKEQWQYASRLDTQPPSSSLQWKSDNSAYLARYRNCGDISTPFTLEILNNRWQTGQTTLLAGRTLVCTIYTTNLNNPFGSFQIKFPELAEIDNNSPLYGFLTQGGKIKIDTMKQTIQCCYKIEVIEGQPVFSNWFSIFELLFEGNLLYFPFILNNDEQHQYILVSVSGNNWNSDTFSEITLDYKFLYI